MGFVPERLNPSPKDRNFAILGCAFKSRDLNPVSKRFGQMGCTFVVFQGCYRAVAGCVPMTDPFFTLGKGKENRFFSGAGRGGMLFAYFLLLPRREAPHMMITKRMDIFRNR